MKVSLVFRQRNNNDVGTSLLAKQQISTARVLGKQKYLVVLDRWLIYVVKSVNKLAGSLESLTYGAVFADN